MVKRHGFTLIELLVVLLIMAFLASGAAVVIDLQGSTAKRINRQGDQLFAQMQFALDDALVRFNALGIVIEVDEENPESIRNYSWRRYNGEDWVTTEAPLGSYTLNENLDWSIEVEETSLEESLDQLLEEEEDKVQPVIVFYPSGEVSEFSMMITLSDEFLQEVPSASDERYEITLNERGQLQRYMVGEEKE